MESTNYQNAIVKRVACKVLAIKRDVVFPEWHEFTESVTIYQNFEKCYDRNRPKY